MTHQKCQMTPEMRRVWEGYNPYTDGIKSHLSAYFAPAVQEETGSPKFHLPRHSPNTRVSTRTEMPGAVQPRTGKHEYTDREAMRDNAVITINFGTLAAALPTVFTKENILAFGQHLHDIGRLPEDVRVFLSPYNESGRAREDALNLVFLFPYETYGGWSEADDYKPRFASDEEVEEESIPEAA